MAVTIETLKKSSETLASSFSCPVNSHTEWDLMAEVIVGVVEGSCFPTWHVAMEACLPDDQHEVFRQNAGRSFPLEKI